MTRRQMKTERKALKKARAKAMRDFRKATHTVRGDVPFREMFTYGFPQ